MTKLLSSLATQTHCCCQMGLDPSLKISSTSEGVQVHLYTQQTQKPQQCETNQTTNNFNTHPHV